MSKVASIGSGKNHAIFWTTALPLPAHLMEITIISAQELHNANCRMRTYAIAWVNSEHKLVTQIARGTNPTWNDKFVFRIEDFFLHSQTSAITINIYSCTHIGKDVVIGTVRVLLSTINPSTSTKCVALMVRRPKSLRPQGVINLGVELLDDYLESMPPEPAFVLKDIVDSPSRNFRDSSNHSFKNSLNRIFKDSPSLSFRDSPNRNFRDSPNRSFKDSNFKESPKCTLDENENQKASHYESKLNRSCSVAVATEAVKHEAEELESKLEKWRIDLEPTEKRMNKSKNQFSCCFGGRVQE